MELRGMNLSDFYRSLISAIAYLSVAKISKHSAYCCLLGLRLLSIRISLLRFTCFFSYMKSTRVKSVCDEVVRIAWLNDRRCRRLLVTFLTMSVYWLAWRVDCSRHLLVWLHSGQSM